MEIIILNRGRDNTYSFVFFGTKSTSLDAEKGVYYGGFSLIEVQMRYVLVSLGDKDLFL